MGQARAALVLLCNPLVTSTRKFLSCGMARIPTRKPEAGCHQEKQAGIVRLRAVGMPSLVS
jgi:hypothetical protein